ncbi:MAG: isoprenylcysteine carboxylmethyltransferase family protein [Gammaproteobacteria bacterium]
MRRFLVLVYGVCCYLVFFGTFLYLIGFLGNFGVPKAIDDGAVTPLVPALLLDLGLIALFGIQHSVMARPAFKQRWIRIVPRSVERSTYVLVTSLILISIFWLWQPIPQTVWRAEAPWLASLLTTVFFAGFLITLLSTYMTDHFDLFGLRQVWLRFVRRPYEYPPFKVSWFYRLIRHPLYSGLILAFWATPHMTVGHLVFAAGMTSYILIAVRFEEQDLVTFLGDRYRDYQREVPMLVPRPGRTYRPVDAGERAPSGMR